MTTAQLKAVSLGVGFAMLLGGFATLLAGCSGSAAHTTLAIPFASDGAQAGTQARGSRFLHEYELPFGTYSSSIVAGPDGAMWFGTYPLYGYAPPTHLGIWRISTKGRKRFFPFENGVYDVAAGGDGRVWFTNPYEYTYNIGAITTTEKLRRIPRAAMVRPSRSRPTRAAIFGTLRSAAILTL